MSGIKETSPIVSDEQCQLDIERLELERKELIQAIQTETMSLLSDEKGLVHAKEELKKRRVKYENLVWERVEIEQAIKKLENSLALIAKKITEAAEAKKTTDIIQTKLDQVKIISEKKAAERKMLQEQKSKLEHDLELLKQNLSKQSAEISDVATRLVREKNLLNCKLSTRVNLEDTLLQLFEDTEIIKEKLHAEEKTKEKLRVILKSDMKELHCRYQDQVAAREELKNRLIKVLTERSSMTTDLRILKAKIQKIFGLEGDFSEAVPMTRELVTLMDEKLSLLNSWDDAPNSDCEDPQLRELLQSEFYVNRIADMVDTQSSAVLVQKLEEEVDFERQRREQWSLEFDNELAALRAYQ